MRHPIELSTAIGTGTDPDMQVFGEFNIHNDHCLIISLDDCPEPNTADATALKPIGQFELNGQVYAIVQTHPSSSQPGTALTSMLSDRELQIVLLVAEGKVNKQIAKYLHISEYTVNTYLRRIFAKLGVANRAAMVCRCATLLNHLRSLNQRSTLTT